MKTNEIEEIRTQEGIIKLLKANFDPSHGLDIHGISENTRKCELIGEILYQSLLAYGEKVREEERKKLVHLIIAMVEKEYPECGGFANNLCGQIEIQKYEM